MSDRWKYSDGVAALNSAACGDQSQWDPWCRAAFDLAEKADKEVQRLRVEPSSWKSSEHAPIDGRDILFRRKPPYSATGNYVIGYWHQFQNIPHFVAQGDLGQIDLNVWTEWTDLPSCAEEAAE